jgi:hypothetical protein
LKGTLERSKRGLSLPVQLESCHMTYLSGAAALNKINTVEAASAKSCLHKI